MVLLSLFFLLYRDPRKKQVVLFTKITLDKFQDFMVKSARPNENHSHLGSVAIMHGNGKFASDWDFRLLLMDQKQI